MLTTRERRFDMVTLAHLHAVLDSVVEIEALITEMHFPISFLPEKRMAALTSELRELLVTLLNRSSTTLRIAVEQ